MEHSTRLFENEHSFAITARITNIVEQPVKVVNNNKPSMINAIGLVLSETIFHPQGGGQPSDKGSINKIPLLAVREDKTESPHSIFHFIDSTLINVNEFQIDQEVELNVDNEFRQQCQRSHSAGHLIADILELNTGFNHYQAQATHGHHFPGGEYIKVVAATAPENIDIFCQEINACLAEEIASNLPTTVCNQDNIRHIQIGDSRRMCGGTHVKSTQEIQQCQVTKIKVGKNKEGKIELTVFYQCF